MIVRTIMGQSHCQTQNRLERLKARRLQFKGQWRLFRRRPYGLLGLIIIACFAVMASVHPLLMATVWDRPRYDPIVGFDPALESNPSTPTPQHLLGTDNFGRDVLSQLVAASRTSFGVGILAAVVAVTVSTLVGAAAGYLGGTADTILMGISDVFVLLPAPVVLLLLGLLLRLEWPAVAVSYGILTGLGVQAIVVKSQTLTVKVKTFIDAARLVGGGHGHVLSRHVLPALVPLAIVNGVFTVVGAVLTESLLSYFGRTTYQLSWGMMIWLGQETFRWLTAKGQWHVILAPAMAIMLYCGAFYLVGRALDDVVNPRLAGRRLRQ